jgi:hypothetical protein
VVTRRARRLVGCVFVSIALASDTASLRQAQPAQDEPALRATFDLMAIDAAGRPVLDLSPADLTVAVGGQPRAVRSLRFVFRGAGSEQSARGGLTVAPSVALPARVVAIMVDENTIRRGREKAIASAAWRVIDSLTPTDMVGLMTLPRPRGQTSLTTDRGPLRPTLNSLSGRARDESASTLVTLMQAPQPTGTDQVPAPDATETGQTVRTEERRDPTDPAAIASAAASARTERGVSTSEDPADQANTQSDSFRTLRLALDEFRKVPGQKFVVYVTGGDGTREGDGGRAAGPDPRVIIDAAAVARVSIHVVLAPESGRPRADQTLERLARETGGTVSTLAGKKVDLGDLTPALGSGYLVELEGADADRRGNVSNLTVQTSRKGVRLIAPSRWSPRDDPLPEPPPPAVPAPIITAAEASRGNAKPRRAEPTTPDPELEAVLARAAQYVDTYLTELGSVVAEESYQQIVRRGAGVTQARRTRADILLIRGEQEWVPFRDVFEVDGKPVRDREERLKKLFLDDPTRAMSEGRRISEEAARYNLGGVFRTINTPTIALSFFQSALVTGFRCQRHGTDNVDGVSAWRIDYEEVGRPTRIKHGTTGADLPSTGSVWVEPASGRVVRTLLRNGDQGTAVELTVRFRPNDTLGLWTPVKMEERYWVPSARGESISAEATYTGFRRFQVATEETIGPPK